MGACVGVWASRTEDTDVPACCPPQALRSAGARVQGITLITLCLPPPLQDNHAINCMCHSTENIYRWRDTAVARASGGGGPVGRSVRAACGSNGACVVCWLVATPAPSGGPCLLGSLLHTALPRPETTNNLQFPHPADDFYPTDRASHIPHLAACAFNGLFISPLALPGERAVQKWGVCDLIGLG